jgi:hypothetical protein
MNYLQIPTKFRKDRRINDVRQTQMHTAMTSIPEPSCFWVRIAIEKLKRYKSQVLIKDELPQRLKESIIISTYKKSDKTDCSNYRGISHSPITYKILSSILVSRLTSHVEEIIWDHECGFWQNRSTTDQTFCTHQIHEEKQYQCFIDFQKAYGSVRRETLYNILIELGITMKLVRIINICLNETYNNVLIGKNL